MDNNMSKKYKCFVCGQEYDTEYKDSFFVYDISNTAHKINHVIINKHKVRMCTNCTRAFLMGYNYGIKLLGYSSGITFKQDPEFVLEDEEVTDETISLLDKKERLVDEND